MTNKTIKELAEEIGISKQAVSKKMKKELYKLLEQQ
ncbi:helix-turn-helix domain-containing protein [Enterococcus faecium]|nr:helix-turn-helix domain-containing protein [Enterococcus faecium]